MAAKWENFNVNPDLNVAGPPVGAPENMPANMINNTIRYVEAAIRELGDEMRSGNAPGETGGVGLDGLGSMAPQNANAVAITGGTINITAGDGINGGSIRSGTVDGSRVGIVNEAVRAQSIVTGPTTQLTLQQLYNIWYPVGRVVLDDTGADTLANAPSVPAGVVATWQRVSSTNYLRIKQDGTTPPRTGGSFSGTTQGAGAHDHGGTQGHALTIAEMPAHDHRLGAAGTGSTLATAAGASSVATGNPTVKTGGGAAHTHGIAAVADHTHDFSVFPNYWSLTAHRRIA